MKTANIIELIGIFIIAAGWLITYFTARLRDQKIEREKQKVKHLNEQLSKFYGPIYSILLENDRIRKIVQEQIGRSAIFEAGGELTKSEFKIWSHYLENYLIPNNRQILNIMKNNFHLTTGYTFKQEYLKWIDYAIGYELQHKQYLDIGKSYGFHSIYNFPIEFRTSIINTMSQLKMAQHPYQSIW
jgi:hypothetical protein